MTDLNGFLFNENCDTILALHVTVAHMNIYMSIVKLDCAICDKESTIGINYLIWNANSQSQWMQKEFASAVFQYI